MTTDADDDSTRVEREFLDRIDCRFPYKNTAAALELIDEAGRISAEAMAGVVYELVHAPRDSQSSKVMRMSLLDRVGAVATNSVVNLMVRVGRRYLHNSKSISDDEIEFAMRLIGLEHRGMHTALGYFVALMDNGGDHEDWVNRLERLERLSRSIQKSWKR